jgi:ATP synthase protein I
VTADSRTLHPEVIRRTLIVSQLSGRHCRARTGTARVAAGQPDLPRSVLLPANYARIVRRSAVIAAVVAMVMVAFSAAVGGRRGWYGGLLAVAVVTVFFAISVVAVGYAARAGMTAMMATAIVTYTVKIIVLAAVVASLAESDFFDPRLFGVTAIGCVLAWTVAQATTTLRMRQLYFEPDGDR